MTRTIISRNSTAMISQYFENRATKQGVRLTIPCDVILKQKESKAIDLTIQLNDQSHRERKEEHNQGNLSGEIGEA